MVLNYVSWENVQNVVNEAGPPIIGGCLGDIASSGLELIAKYPHSETQPYLVAGGIILFGALNVLGHFDSLKCQPVEYQIDQKTSQ